MAIVVDKQEKRRNIALACKEIILQAGVENITISQLAAKADIGKGTIYQYFANKEDILLELVCLVQKDYKEETLEIINSIDDEKEKIKIFFTNCYKEKYNGYRKFFKEFIGVSYCKTNCALIFFQKEWYFNSFEILSSIIKEGINKKRLKKESINLVDGILNSLVVYFIFSFYNKTIDETKNSINLYLDTIFKMIKV
ncbi:TetR/AcrR family transcriptional regulator [Malaciobacter mytili]|uniref:TetR/AcrR family transcriptional regulator n=1 Tax=Malaciobacter mytili TaxID=603050 RepID=UPI003A87A07C